MASRLSKAKTESNAALLKSLLRLPGNKYCCDCKTADHPRWASWNLGIFLCIRCSGIHRSMGTHISRVKSVDLDSWTDEQVESMVAWGNSKANKYWEAQLDAGHIPADGKVDTFIKTKYNSRRWCSHPERPDPDDLSDEENNVRPAPTRVAPPKATTSRQVPMQAPKQAESLLNFDHQPATTITQPTKQAPPPPAVTSSNISLLASSVPKTNSSQAPPRNDLKMSIMSLYANAPRPQQSIPKTSATSPSAAQSSFSDLNDLFSGMNVASAQPQPRETYETKSEWSGPRTTSAFDDLYQTSDVWKS